MHAMMMPYRCLLTNEENIELISIVQANIQARYRTQRETRNAEKRQELLSPNFPGVRPDPILAKLADPVNHANFKDERHCLVFWARPPTAVRDLIAEIQQRLLEAAPGLWIMPPEALHMTVLEVAHSLTAAGIENLVQQMGDNVEKIVNITCEKFETMSQVARLVCPLLNFDDSSLALQWLPAASPSHDTRGLQDGSDGYTYHHLRRDVHAAVRDVGLEVASRYVTPSAHLTICRFINSEDLSTRDQSGSGGVAVDHAQVSKFVETIEEINAWLIAEFWPQAKSSRILRGGEWVVGEEKGLECRRGTLWYGGGERVRMGREVR